MMRRDQHLVGLEQRGHSGTIIWRRVCRDLVFMGVMIWIGMDGNGIG
jgi:hypothetical protein